MRRPTKLLLWTVILSLAVFARFWQITSLPPGLFPDQAANGEDALAIPDGNFQPFYERNNGREALFFYLQAAFIAAFDVHVWPMFAASALVGVLTVGVTIAAGNRSFGSPVGFIAGLFLATNPWHVSISRTGFRAVLVPLFIALTWLFAAQLFQGRTPRERLRAGTLLGIAFGLGWYTYIAWRPFIGVVTVISILLLLHDAIRQPRFAGILRFRGALVATFLAAALTVWPLLSYFSQHPESFFGRASHVSIFNPDLHHGDLPGTFVHVLTDSILAFFTVGDQNPRHNVPGHPFLSPIAAILALIGIGIAMRRSGQCVHRLFLRQPVAHTIPYVAVLVALPLMLVPTIATAEGIPHGLRSIGEIPAVFWIAGIGGTWIWRRLTRLVWPSTRMVALIIFGTALISPTVPDLLAYFDTAANSPAFSHAYRADLTPVSAFINARAAASGTTYLVLEGFSEMTVHFLTANTGHPYTLVLPEQSTRIQLEREDVMIFPQSTLTDAQRYAEAHPHIQVIEHEVNAFGETAYLVLTRTQ